MGHAPVFEGRPTTDRPTVSMAAVSDAPSTSSTGSSPASQPSAYVSPQWLPAERFLEPSRNRRLIPMILPVPSRSGSSSNLDPCHNPPRAAPACRFRRRGCGPVRTSGSARARHRRSHTVSSPETAGGSEVAGAESSGLAGVQHRPPDAGNPPLRDRARFPHGSVDRSPPGHRAT